MAVQIDVECEAFEEARKRMGTGLVFRDGQCPRCKFTKIINEGNLSMCHCVKGDPKPFQFWADNSIVRSRPGTPDSIDAMSRNSSASDLLYVSSFDEPEVIHEALAGNYAYACRHLRNREENVGAACEDTVDSDSEEDIELVTTPAHAKLQQPLTVSTVDSLGPLSAEGDLTDSDESSDSDESDDDDQQVAPAPKFVPTKPLLERSTNSRSFQHRRIQIAS